VKQPPPTAVLDILREGGLELIGTVPEDERIYDYDLDGRPTVDMPEDSRSVKAAFEIFDRIFA
jgi:CO dehydrogenase maturation factor